MRCVHCQACRGDRWLHFLQSTTPGILGATYVLAGPATLTQIDQVQTARAVIGRPLRWEELPLDAARDQLVDAFGDAFAEGALQAWAAFVSRPESVTTTVQDVTGAPAHTFGEWAADHAEDFR